MRHRKLTKTPKTYEQNKQTQDEQKYCENYSQRIQNPADGSYVCKTCHGKHKA